MINKIQNNKYIHIYIYYFISYLFYICIHLYIYIIYLSMYLYIYIYIYIYLYIAIVCDHEITHKSYAICGDKIYIKLYGPFLWMGCN